MFSSPAAPSDRVTVSRKGVKSQGHRKVPFGFSGAPEANDIAAKCSEYTSGRSNQSAMRH